MSPGLQTRVRVKIWCIIVGLENHLSIYALNVISQSKFPRQECRTDCVMNKICFENWYLFSWISSIPCSQISVKLLIKFGKNTIWHMKSVFKQLRYHYLNYGRSYHSYAFARQQALNLWGSTWRRSLILKPNMPLFTILHSSNFYFDGYTGGRFLPYTQIWACTNIPYETIYLLSKLYHIWLV